MPDRDEWGLDPSVQGMRRLFGRMEILQKDLLDRSRVSPFDERLGRARVSARHLFEQAWPQAQRKGLIRNEEAIVSLYIHCFVKTLSREKIMIPGDVFSGDEKIFQFISETFR